jgi:hypothetical protein
LIAWAYEQQVGSPTRKAVLLALANRANHDNGRCDPLIENLAKETELGISTVRQAIKDLCEAGVITRSRKRRADGSYSGYSYTFPGAGAPPPGASAGPPPGASGPEPEEVLEPATKVVHIQDLESKTETVNTQTLLADFIDRARESGADPPRQVIGHLARELKKLVDEGAAEDELRAALERLFERSLSPSMLSSVLFDVRQRGGAGANGTVLDAFLAKHGNAWPTGSRMVRGENGATFVQDALGYDKPTHAVPWSRPTRTEIIQALK